MRPSLLLRLAAAGVFMAGAFVGPSRATETDVTQPAHKHYDLKGVVQGPDGAALANATVYIYTAHPRVGVGVSCPSCYVDCGKTAQSAQDGRFVIPSLAPDLIFRILVLKDGYISRFVSEADPARPLPAIRLERQPPSGPDSDDVTGTVVDDAGQPIAGAEIATVGVSWDGAGEVGSTVDGVAPLAISGADGRFRLVASKRVKTFDGKLLPLALVDGMIKARGFATRPQVLNPGPTADNVVHMTRGATVTGRVVDTKGRPINQAVVEVLQTDLEVERFTGWNTIATGPDGRFSLPCATANTPSYVCVHMASLLRLHSAAVKQVFRTPGDGGTVDVGVIRTVPETELRGRLAIEGGKPLQPGMRVLLSRDDTWDGQEALIGADGSFAFRGIPPGEAMTISSVLTIGGVYYGASKGIVVDGKEPARVNVVLTPRT